MVLNVLFSVFIVMSWILMWPVAIMHERYMERPDSQGA